MGSWHHWEKSHDLSLSILPKPENLFNLLPWINKSHCTRAYKRLDWMVIHEAGVQGGEGGIILPPYPLPVYTCNAMTSPRRSGKRPRLFSAVVSKDSTNMAGRYFLRKMCSHIKHPSTNLIPRTASVFLPKNICLRMAGTSSSKAKEKREM